MYRQIADELRDQIRNGDLAEGDLLPSITALVQRYSTADGTIRKAMAALKAEGLTESVPGRGVAVRKQRALLRVANDRFARANRLGRKGKGAFVVELERQGMVPRSDVVVDGPIRPPDDVAELLDLGDEDQAVSRRRLMFADAEPVQIATSYVPWTIAEGTQITNPDSGPGGIYARIEEAGHQLARFQEDVGARPATPEEADELRIDTGEPVLLVTRVAYAEPDLPVEVCQHVMNATRYRLTYRFDAG